MSGGPGTPPDDAPGMPEERELRAAEYVLGTLPGPERAALDAERAHDPTLDAMLRAWERRLAPLSLAAPEETPPPQVWAAIAEALQGEASTAPVSGDAAGSAAPTAANDNRVAALTRQVRRWRRVSAGAGLIAAGLALFFALAPPRRAPEATGRYVAVVTSGGTLPALIVSIDTTAGTAQVRPVEAKAPEGRSLELWYVGPGQAPKTLGLVGTAGHRVPLPVGAVAGEGVFAVSVEPPGGSPTGQPTGQVIYTGKLIRD